jgi:hypothetical protein
MFFSRDENLEKGLSWYKGLWEFDPQRHRFALEGSTEYTKMPHFPNVAERVAKVQADFRFIYIVRDPIKRIESALVHGQRTGWKGSANFNGTEIHPNLINVSKYAYQIGEYYKRFDADRILILLNEDLRDNRIQTVNKACAFLGLDGAIDPVQLAKEYNKGADKRVDGKLWRFIKPVSRMLPKGQRNKIHKRFSHEVDRDQYELSPQLRESVLNELKDDLKKLSGEYGVNISRWGLSV